MAGGILGYKPYAARLDGWGLDVTIVRTDDGRFFFPVRQLCKHLEISLPSQLEALRADDRYTEALHPFRIPTEGGMQETVCIRRRECAWWLANINPRRVRSDVRERLQDYQAALMAAADRLAFGDLSSVLRDGAIVPARPMRGELTFSCPRCGAPLCFAVDGSEIHLRINPA